MKDLLIKEYGVFMDLAELASLLRLKIQSLYNQIHKGKLDIPHIKRGKKYLFPTEAVADYLSSQLAFS